MKESSCKREKGTNRFLLFLMRSLTILCIFTYEHFREKGKKVAAKAKQMNGQTAQESSLVVLRGSYGVLRIESR